MLHEFSTRALGPCFKLVNGSSTERIASSNHDLLAFVLETGSKLTDRRRLAGTVHANHKHHMRLTLEFKRRRVLEQAFRFITHDVEHLLCRKRLAQSIFAKRIRQKERRFDADISLDEMLFEFFERLVRNFTGTDNTLEFAHQGVTGLGKAALNCRK